MSDKKGTSNPENGDQSIIQEIRYFFEHIFDLREGLDRWGTIESIEKNIQLQGSNVWLLISGLFIASIGLDTNSVAVIIGAMLISPLMSPILGIGLGIGINDRKMILRSLFNFTVAVAISLIVSSVYFFLTPLGDATTEILGRTRPTILDVGVAFFGGLAGIVASSRKEKMNAVPGVAIATALLPPLCVTGFGIANGDLSIIWGSFYLFFLNSVFVSLATFLVVRILRFPYREFLDQRQKLRSNFLVTAFVVIVCIPAGRMLFEILTELSEKNKLETFVSQTVNNEEHQTLKWTVSGSDEEPELKLYLVGEYMDSTAVGEMQADLRKNGLDDYTLSVIQFEQEPEDFDKMSEEIKMNVLTSVSANQQLLDEKESRISTLIAERDSLKRDTIQFNMLSRELKVLFPEIQKLGLSKLEGDSIDISNNRLVHVEFKPKTEEEKQKDIQDRMYDFIHERLPDLEFDFAEWPELIEN